MTLKLVEAPFRWCHCGQGRIKWTRDPGQSRDREAP